MRRAEKRIEDGREWFGTFQDWEQMHLSEFWRVVE